MHLLVVRLNDLAIDLCCMHHLLHAFLGGSVELFSNIGESVALTTVCAQLVVRSTDTVNSARLPNRQDWRIGQNIIKYIFLTLSISTATIPTPRL